jgi:signal transduction histidine kinase
MLETTIFQPLEKTLPKKYLSIILIGWISWGMLWLLPPLQAQESSADSAEQPSPCQSKLAKWEMPAEALQAYKEMVDDYYHECGKALAYKCQATCQVQSPSLTQLGLCEVCRGFTALLNEDLQLATSSFTSAAECFEQAGIPKLQCRSLNNLGVTLENSQHFAESEAAYQQALDIAIAQPAAQRDSLDIIHYYYNIVNLQIQFNDFPGALQYAQQGLEIARKIRDTLYQVDFLDVLALMQDQFKETDMALQTRQEIIDLLSGSTELEHQLILFKSRLELAKTPGDARLLLNAFEQLAKERNIDQRTKVDLWYFYAGIAEKLGDHESAFEYNKKTVAAFETNQTYTFQYLFSSIAIIEEFLSQGQYQNVLRRVPRLLHYAREMAALNVQADLLDQYSRALANTGQIDSAYHYLRVMSVLQDSIKEKSKEKDFMRVQMSYLFEKEKEIMALQQAQQQAATNAQLLRQRQLLTGSLISLGLLGAFLYYYRRNYKNKLASERRLQAANQQLQLSNQKLDRFAHSISHDILSNIDLLLSTGNILVEPHHNPSSLQHYYRQSKQTLSTTKDYCLQLLKSARERDSQATQKADTNSVLQQALEHNKLALDTYAPKVTYDTLPPLPISEGDLLQVFQNLLSNAIAFAGPQPDGHIAIRTENTPSEIRIGVLDNGPGIPEDQLESIFEQGVSFKQDGNGQGLAFVRDIVESCSGRVWAERSALGGAGVWIAFPSALHRSDNHLMLN